MLPSMTPLLSLQRSTSLCLDLLDETFHGLLPLWPMADASNTEESTRHQGKAKGHLRRLPACLGSRWIWCVQKIKGNYLYPTSLRSIDNLVSSSNIWENNIWWSFVGSDEASSPPNNIKAVKPVVVFYIMYIHVLLLSSSCEGFDLQRFYAVRSVIYLRLSRKQKDLEAVDGRNDLILAIWHYYCI